LSFLQTQEKKKERKEGKEQHKKKREKKNLSMTDTNICLAASEISGKFNNNYV